MEYLNINMHKTSSISRLAQKVIPPNRNFTIQRTYTQEVVSFKKKSQVIQELATDDKGIHPHLLKGSCTKPTCGVTQCPNLCNNLKEVSTKGYFTHNPIPGKYCKYLSSTDGNNASRPQYYVKNSDKSKKVTGSEAQNYHNKKEIKSNSAMNNYINTPEINDKIPE